MSKEQSKVLLGLDIETTGTNIKTDVILEVAIAAIDIETLQIVESYRSVILPDGQLRMDDFVTRMHTTNGLLEEIRKGEGLGALKVYTAVKTFTEKYPNSMLLGRNVGTFDKAFLEEKSPGILANTSYRHLDLSSVREFFKLVAPQFIEGGPPKPEGHRALSDIEGDVLLLKFLKKGLNVDVSTLAV